MEQMPPHDTTSRPDMHTLKSKARSTAVKIDEPSAIRCILQWLSDEKLSWGCKVA